MKNNKYFKILIKLFLFLIITVCANSLYSQSKYLPKTYLNNALNYAISNFSPDAAMYGITSALAVDTTGRLASWVYWFYKPGSNDSGYAVTIILIAGFPIPTGLGTPNLPGTLLRPLGTSFCESNLAILAAENSGGTIFRQLNPNTNIFANIAKIPGSQDTSKPYWTVLYRDSVTTNFSVFTIDGITCTNIPLGIQNNEYNLPGDFYLEPNYPNPFNPVTNISFLVSKSAVVKLSVYNSNGKEVEILADNFLNPGRYKIEWNAVNYSSGIYYYCLKSGEFVQTRKMVLIK